MKTTILLALISLFFSSVLQAQIEESRIKIGGSIGFNHEIFKQTTAINNPNYTNFSAFVSSGKFYADNKLAGIFLNYTYNENASAANARQYLYGAGNF